MRGNLRFRQRGHPPGGKDHPRAGEEPGKGGVVQILGGIDLIGKIGEGADARAQLLRVEHREAPGVVVEKDRLFFFGHEKYPLMIG